MSVAAGLSVLQAMLEAEIAAACGPKGKHDPGRTAVRHGSGKGSVTLGGRRVPVARPRARTLDGREVALASYTHFAADDLLTEVVMERMLAGVATRRHARTAEPVGAQVGEEAKSTSRSAISRRFVRQTETALAELMSRDLSELDIKVLMLDGEHMAERCVVVALAITADGTKVPVGLWDGSTENKTVVRSLLADLVERGLAFDDGLLVVIDGAKALSAAVREVFGAKAAIKDVPCTSGATSPITCPTRRRRGWTPSWSRRSPTPTPTQGCAMPNTLPGNWIRNIPARPPPCARGCRRCSPSPGSASTAASPRPSPPVQPHRVDDLHRPSHQPQRGGSRPRGGGGPSGSHRSVREPLGSYGSCHLDHQTAGTAVVQAQWAKNRGYCLVTRCHACWNWRRPWNRRYFLRTQRIR